MSQHRDTATPLTPSALLSSAKAAHSREAKAKAPLGAENETIITSRKSRALLGSARLAARGRTKALSAQIASPCEANSTLWTVHPRLSHEAMVKSPLCANSIADSVSL